MVKKTARKPRSKKQTGGSKNTDMLGPLIPQSLYDLANNEPEKHKLEKLENMYKTKEDELKYELEDLEKRLKDTQTANSKAQLNGIQQKKLDVDKNDRDRKFGLNVAKYGTNILSSTLINIVMLGYYVIENAKFAFKLVANAGQGFIIKVVGIIILLIIIITVGFTTPAFSNPMNVLGSNDIIKNILNTDVENYIMPYYYNSYSYIYSLTNSINNLLPDNFKYKFASLTNSFNYITTGKNIYDDLLVDRETITDGRSDNIFHINFKSQSLFASDKTFCALSPKEVEFKYNGNLYTSDYNNLDEDLKTDINYPTSYTIPITNDAKGKYVLNPSTSYYNNDNDNDNAKYKSLPKLFKVSGPTNEITFNTVNAITVKSTSNNMYGIIGLYGTRLLNPNYKGPILKLTTINYSQSGINTNPANNIETPVYYENGLYKYYDNTKNNKYVEIPKDRIYYVNILYDQSGNNRDFQYKPSDNKYQPEFKLINNIRCLQFVSKNILYLERPINNKQMRIKTKINVNKTDSHYTSIQNQDESYMNLLSTNTRPIIKLKINKTDDTYSIDIQKENAPNEKNKNNNIYIPGNIIDINIDINGSDSGIETMGTVHDDRSDTTKAGDIRGTKLTSSIEAHNFIGELYELYIYDRSKL